eukprot:gene17187-20478_t
MSFKSGFKNFVDKSKDEINNLRGSGENGKGTSSQKSTAPPPKPTYVSSSSTVTSSTTPYNGAPPPRPPKPQYGALPPTPQYPAHVAAPTPQQKQTPVATVQSNAPVSLTKQPPAYSHQVGESYNTAPVSLYKSKDGATESPPPPTSSGPFLGKSGVNIPASFNKHTEQVETHSRIALHTIGAPVGDKNAKANIPPLLLNDPMYIANIQYTEIILEVDNVTLKPVVVGEKQEPIAKKEKMIIYKTTVEDVIIIQIKDVYIYTSLKEKTSVRVYAYHYMITDNFCNYFIIKLSEVPIKNEYSDKTAKKMENASSKVEKGSLVVSKGLVSGGTYFAKGAAKVGNVYKNNTKAYNGAEMTEEQRLALEDPNSEANKSLRNAEKVSQGTSSVKKGIVGAFGFAGTKISEGVRSTEWYKEKEEKKKKEEELYGKNEKKAAGGGMASTGVSAIKNVWGGLEEGVLISARGVRDASVDAKKHTDGEYEAEISKKKWNAAGNMTVSVVNVMSIVSTTWIKGALYAASGAISYDPDKRQNLSGSYWKAGWLATRTDLMSGVGWTPRWVVLRNPTIAIYSSPRDPSDKPLAYTYITKVKGVKKLTEERIQRSHGFEVVTTAKSIYFSTYTPEVDYSQELLAPPHPDSEQMQWIDSIINISHFVGEHISEDDD